MKKVFSALYTALCHFALAFSGIIIFFWLFFPTQTSYIDHSNLRVFLTFSVVFGLSSILFALPKAFLYVIKVLLHYLVNVTVFVFTFVNVGGYNEVRAFLAGGLFTVVYAFVFALSRLLKLLASR